MYPRIPWELAAHF